MPIFDINCLECHETFEKLVRHNDECELTCPKCDGHQLEKIIGCPHFILKGEGFYKPSLE
jgi:putative FmdB family regulatory protein